MRCCVPIEGESGCEQKNCCAQLVRECSSCGTEGCILNHLVDSSLQRQCHLLGRVPANVKFEVVQVLDDGSYLSWIAPDRKSKKKGSGKITVRVIEYTIEQEGQQQIYRLITDLTDISLFPALVLAEQYHQRWEAENTLDEFKTHLNARKMPIRSKTPRLVVQEIYGW